MGGHVLYYIMVNKYHHHMSESRQVITHSGWFRRELKKGSGSVTMEVLLRQMLK